MSEPELERAALEKLAALWGAEYGYSDFHNLPEAGFCCIAPFLFTYAILSGLHGYGYEDRWCYETYEKARSALAAWNGTGEPKGWHRHPLSGRRVDKDGTETVYW